MTSDRDTDVTEAKPPREDTHPLASDRTGGRASVGVLAHPPSPRVEGTEPSFPSPPPGPVAPRMEKTAPKDETRPLPKPEPKGLVEQGPSIVVAEESVDAARARSVLRNDSIDELMDGLAEPVLPSKKKPRAAPLKASTPTPPDVDVDAETLDRPRVPGEGRAARSGRGAATVMTPDGDALRERRRLLAMVGVGVVAGIAFFGYRALTAPVDPPRSGSKPVSTVDTAAVTGVASGSTAAPPTQATGVVAPPAASVGSTSSTVTSVTSASAAQPAPPVASARTSPREIRRATSPGASAQSQNPDNAFLEDHRK